MDVQAAGMVHAGAQLCAQEVRDFLRLIKSFCVGGKNGTDNFDTEIMKLYIPAYDVGPIITDLSGIDEGVVILTPPLSREDLQGEKY